DICFASNPLHESLARRLRALISLTDSCIGSGPQAMLRSLSVFPLALALATALAAEGTAQVKVQTESIKPSQPPAAAPPEASQAPGATGTVPAKKPTDAARSAPRDSAPPPEVIFDVSRLPEPVKRTREKVLAAARSGDLNQVAAVMR